MSHLWHAAIELDSATNDALGADRQQPSELVALHVEIDQCQCAGIVGTEHPIRASPEAGLMGLDAHRECCDPVRLELPDRRRGAPVDDPGWQMPDEVKDQ